MEKNYYDGNSEHVLEGLLENNVKVEKLDKGIHFINKFLFQHFNRERIFIFNYFFILKYSIPHTYNQKDHLILF